MLHHTLSNLYLSSDPVRVEASEENLLIRLADEQTIVVPLSLLGELAQNSSLSSDAQVLVLRRPPQIDHVRWSGFQGLSTLQSQSATTTFSAVTLT